MTKYERARLAKLQQISEEELTDDQKAEIEELEQLEEEEAEKEKQKVEKPKDESKSGSKTESMLEEILKCLKPNQEEHKNPQEIPVPKPPVTNEDLKDAEKEPESTQESGLKKFLKAIW